MPIRSQERARYPADWPAISKRIREDRAGNKCECTGQCGEAHPSGIGNPATTITRRGPAAMSARCNAPNGVHVVRAIEGPKFLTWEECEAGALEMYGGRYLDRAVKIVLTVAHLDHTPENCGDENLAAMCQRCHLLLDKDEHQRNRRRTLHGRKADRDLFDDEDQ